MSGDWISAVIEPSLLWALWVSSVEYLPCSNKVLFFRREYQFRIKVIKFIEDIVREVSGYTTKIRTPLVRMHLADYTSSEGSTGNQWTTYFKTALHIVNQCYKFRGRNSLRGEDCNNLTLTCLYLFKSSLFISLIMFIYVLYHVYRPNHSWLFV